MNEVWTNRFMNLAEVFASWSKDPSTKVGSVIVGQDREIISSGYNGIPRGVTDPLHPDSEELSQTPEDYQINKAIWDSRMGRPQKYMWFEHAERNAIYNAARHGISVKGTTMYVTPLAPCADCARAMIQSGIKRVFYAYMDVERWTESTDVALLMFKEAGIPTVPLVKDSDGVWQLHLDQTKKSVLHF